MSLLAQLTPLFRGDFLVTHIIDISTREEKEGFGSGTYMSDEGRKGGRRAWDLLTAGKHGGEKGRIICEDGRGLVHVELHATTSTSNDNAGISV